MECGAFPAAINNEGQTPSDLADDYDEVVQVLQTEVNRLGNNGSLSLSLLSLSLSYPISLSLLSLLPSFSISPLSYPLSLSYSLSLLSYKHVPPLIFCSSLLGIDIEDIKCEEERQMLDDAKKLRNSPDLEPIISANSATPIHVAAAKNYTTVLK